MLTNAFTVNAERTAIAMAFQTRKAALIADRVLHRAPPPNNLIYSVYSAAQASPLQDTKVRGS